jgi:hypothetical protein
MVMTTLRPSSFEGFELRFVDTGESTMAENLTVVAADLRGYWGQVEAPHEPTRSTPSCGASSREA